nr:Hsp20/alpha crystallin family protein [Candidatus Freyarchaeota archaeon]
MSRVDIGDIVACEPDVIYRTYGLFGPWLEVLPSRRIVEFRSVGGCYPRTNMEDNGDSYIVTAEIPGLSKDDIKVNVSSDILQISGEVKEEGDKNYLYRERPYEFSRCICFPEEIIPDKVEADLKDGILTLKVHKKEPTTVEKPVEVKVKEK